jgi:hypothetical protein
MIGLDNTMACHNGGGDIMGPNDITRCLGLSMFYFSFSETMHAGSRCTRALDYKYVFFFPFFISSTNGYLLQVL